MKILILFILFIPSLSFADVDFYSYGGFETVENGFTYMKNVYNDPQYGFLVFTILTLAILVSSTLNSVKGLLGQSKGSQAISSIFLCVFGFTIYQATILPKTTVHVYDTVLNKTTSVSDVPLLIATLTGGFNLIERLASDTFSADTINRDEHGGGATIQMLSEILNKDPLKYHPYLAKSIQYYIDDCMPPALTSSVGSYANFDLEKLLYSSDNLLVEMEKLASTYQMTVYYDVANRGGINHTCAASWTNIKAKIQLPATYTDFYSDSCEGAGFEVDIGACKARIDDIGDFILNSTGTVNTATIAANQALAHSLYKHLSENPVSYMEDIVNLKNQSAGLSTLVAAGSWLPTIRYSTMMIIVGILPLITLMFFTPMLGTALKYTAGLLLFISVWGLTDTAIHGITLSNIENQLFTLQRTNLSFYTFMTAPTELQKAVATMGKMQSMGLILATILVGIFFKISGHAFSNMGEKLQGDIDRISADAGNQVFDPAGRMSTIDSYSQAAFKSQNLQNFGTEAYAAATSKPVAQDQIESHEYFQGIQSTASQAMQQEATIRASERVGSTLKKQELADRNEMPLSDFSSLQSQARTQNSIEDDFKNRNSRDILTEKLGGDDPLPILTLSQLSKDSDDFASASVKNAITQTTTADNFVDAAKKQAFKDVGFVASSEDLQKMYDNGANLNEQSMAVAKSNGGVAVTTSFNDDNGSYDLFNVSTKSESTSSDDSSSSINAGTTTNAGAMSDVLKTVDGEIAHEQGDIIIDQALGDDNMSSQLSVLNGYSDSLLANVTASDTDSSTKGLYAGASGQLPLTGILKGGLKVIKGAADVFGGGPKELPKGAGGTYTKPGVNDRVLDKALGFIDNYVPSVDLNARADWSGSNTDRDTREIESKAFLAYILDQYRDEYELASTEEEKEKIRDEYAVVNELFRESINSYAMNLADDNISDINVDGSFWGDSFTDEMQSLQDMREDQTIKR